ncbi:MAG: DUF305 domain-containing protein [Geminicoccaceae bacterium]
MQIDRMLRVSALVTLLAISPLTAQEAGQQGHHPAAAAAAAPPAAKPAPSAMPGAGPATGQGGMMMPGAGDERHMAMMRECMGMMGSMMQGGDGMVASLPDDPVAGAFAAINNRMHRDMAVPAGAKPDIAFAQAMVAHHQGAIDMAKVVLGFGADPEIRKLAQDVITAQQGEIEFLQQWLARQSPQ